MNDVNCDRIELRGRGKIRASFCQLDLMKALRLQSWQNNIRFVAVRAEKKLAL